MKKVIGFIFILLFILFMMSYCQANNLELQTGIRVIAPANIQFQDGEKIYEKEVEVGQKLDEPSHDLKDGYIFDGWYYNGHKWNFENDLVTEHMTLVAKYVKKENYNINVKVDETSIMKPTILNEVDISSELEEVNLNDDIDIILEVKDATNIIKEDERQILLNIIEKNDLNLGQFIDISMFVEINKDSSTQKAIHNTKNKVTIELTIPEDIRFKNKKYYILRLHDSVVEKIFEGFPSKDWKINIETDKFSIYAIAYTDEDYKGLFNPQTSDDIVNYFIMGTIALIGLLISIVILKRNKKDEQEQNH